MAQLYNVYTVKFRISVKYLFSYKLQHKWIYGRVLMDQFTEVMVT